jgi:uncharacterized protein (DUF2249 family)
MPEAVISTFNAEIHADGRSTNGGRVGGCACGESEAPGYPELDARAIPHAIRHGAIFGALEGISPGEGLVLQQRAPDTYDVEYLERGPQNWRLCLVRRVA